MYGDVREGRDWRKAKGAKRLLQDSILVPFSTFHYNLLLLWSARCVLTPSLTTSSRHLNAQQMPPCLSIHAIIIANRRGAGKRDGRMANTSFSPHQFFIISLPAATLWLCAYKRVAIFAAGKSYGRECRCT